MSGETKSQHLVILFGGTDKRNFKKAVGYLESLKPQYAHTESMPSIFSVNVLGDEIFMKLAAYKIDFLVVDINLKLDNIFSVGPISTSLYGVSVPGEDVEDDSGKDYGEELKLSIQLEDYERAAICRDIINNKQKHVALLTYDKQKQK